MRDPHPVKCVTEPEGLIGNSGSTYTLPSPIQDFHIYIYPLRYQIYSVMVPEVRVAKLVERKGDGAPTNQVKLEHILEAFNVTKTNLSK